MYTIFINERPLYLSETPYNTDNDCKTFKYEEGCNAVFDEVFNQLYHAQLKQACIYHPNLEKLWQAFEGHFKVIKAAGGVVKNAKNEILFIKRFDKWDLPKGKIEKKDSSTEETAMREVEEECNLFRLKIIKELPTTYHFYYTHQPILKIVYWYEMFSENSTQNLIPQTEEGIQEVGWKTKNEIPELMKNSYENIKLLLKVISLNN